MPNPYRDLFDTPGGLRASAAAAVGRLPISMVAIAVVLLVSATSGSFAVAGLTSAAVAVGEAVGGPFVSRVIDRYGQRRITPWAALGHALLLGLLVLLADQDAPPAALVATAFGAGALLPNVGALIRARWRYLLGPSPLLPTAFSWEAVVDEMIFVTGPPLVTALVAATAPPWGLALCVAALWVGLALLLVQRASEPPPAGDAHAEGPPAWRLPGLPLIVAVMAGLGVLFGTVEVASVALAQERGTTRLAGLLLAVYAAGSLVAGLAYGARPSLRPLPDQLRLGLLGMATAAAMFPVAAHLSVPALTLAAFLGGFAVAPTLIITFQLIERLSPATRLTEALSLGTAGILLGVAVGSALAGAAVDAVGAANAYGVALAGGLVALAVGVAGHGSLQRALAQADATVPTGG